MAQVTIIGAGSIVFCKTLVLDLLATPGMEATEFDRYARTIRETYASIPGYDQAPRCRAPWRSR